MGCREDHLGISQELYVLRKNQRQEKREMGVGVEHEKVG